MKVIVSCVPAAVIGLWLNDWMEETFYNYQTVSVMLVLYGVLFVPVSYTHLPKMTTTFGRKGAMSRAKRRDMFSTVSPLKPAFRIG